MRSGNLGWRYQPDPTDPTDPGEQLVRGRAVDLAEETLGEGAVAEGAADGLDRPVLVARPSLRSLERTVPVPQTS